MYIWYTKTVLKKSYEEIALQLIVCPETVYCQRVDITCMPHNSSHRRYMCTNHDRKYMNIQ